MQQVHISKMTGKLDGFKAISTNTITNPFCIKMSSTKKENIICGKCYSVNMLETYRKNMQDCLQHNSELLSNSIIDDVHLPFIIDAYIRIDAHGELINNTHLINIYNLAIKNPHTTFAIWSKRKDIVNSVSKIMDTPSNVILIFSNSFLFNGLNIGCLSHRSGIFLFAQLSCRCKLATVDDMCNFSWCNYA